MEGQGRQAQRYWVEIAGRRYGPADLDTLASWKAEGRVLPETELIEEASDVRRQAKEFPELFPPEAAHAAPPRMSEAPSGPARDRRSLPLWVVASLVVGGLCVFGTAILAAILFPVFSQAKFAAKRTLGTTYLKQLCMATTMYCQDFDGSYPPRMDTALAMKPALMSYVKSELPFSSVNPRGGKILGNTKLAGRPASDVLEPSRTGLFFDSRTWERGRSLVAFADGRVELEAMPLILQSLGRPLKPPTKGVK